MPQVEVLEDRRVPAVLGSSVAMPYLAQASAAATAGPVGLTPAQIRHAYNFDQVRFGTAAGDGTGQTIAIIGAYDNPDIAHDLVQFDRAFGLPDPPSFTRVDQNGGTNYPGTDPKGAWEQEAALDVEWAHALAPGARIVLVEAATATFDDLNAAVDYARNLPGVSVVSMSYGGGEFDGENAYDSFFATPPGHAGVTFVASTGDVGGATEYPATSPDVLAVGGTTLYLNAAGNYAGENGWSRGGGGPSGFESQPGYQTALAGKFGSTRETPDVAFDADPNSGVAVYDSYNNGTAHPWSQLGGTSFSAPAWAALIAVVNQGRARIGRPALDGPTQTLPAIYRLPAGDFHDVNGGGGAVRATAGYDLVTGRGSPVANFLVNDLVQEGGVATHFRVTLSAAGITAGVPLTVTVTALDGYNVPVAGYTGTVHFSASDGRAVLPVDYTFTAADRGSHTFGVTFKTAGTQSLRVSDGGALSGAAGGIAVGPAATVRLLVAAAAPVTAGTPFPLTVVAVDAFGNRVTGYRGTVLLQSSGGLATLPRPYTFQAADGGGHTFAVTLATPGTWLESVADVANPVLRGSLGVTARAAVTTNGPGTKPHSGPRS